MKRLPRTLWEAVDMGFEVCGHESMQSADELTSEGMVILTRADEYLEVPFVGRFKYSTPRQASCSCHPKRLAWADSFH